MRKIKLLLKIVKTWNIKGKPEYRGFKCAICQRYIHKAYYYWLNAGGYKTPVHFCKNCQKKFESGGIEITKATFKVKRKTFGLDFEKEFILKCREIIKKWDTKVKPVYRIFTCDKCLKNIYKAYHIWLNLNNRLSEIHLCKNCGQTLLEILS